MSNEMNENKTQFSEEAWDELNVVMEAVREEINTTCKAFLENDKELSQRVAPLGCWIIRGKIALLFTPVSITTLIGTEDARFILNGISPIAKGDLKWRDALLVTGTVNSNKIADSIQKDKIDK